MIAPKPSLPENPGSIIVIHDVRDPVAREALRRARAAWPRSDVEVEALDRHHVILLIGPGGASRLAA